MVSWNGCLLPLAGYENLYSIAMNEIRHQDMNKRQSPTVDLESRGRSGQEKRDKRTFTLRISDKNKQPHHQQLLKLTSNKRAQSEDRGTSRRSKGSILLNILPFLKKRDRGADASKASLKPSRSVSGYLFAKPLAEICDSSGGLPASLMSLLKYLLEVGPTTCGIFRKSACSKSQQEIRSKIDVGLDVDFEHGHLAGSVLKDFLRSLPECVLTEAYVPDWLKLYDVGNVDLQLEKSAELISRLPPCNYNLLAHVLCVLYRITQRADENKMTSSNLGICVGQSLLWSVSDSVLNPATAAHKVPRVIGLLIDHFPTLFGLQSVQLFSGLQQQQTGSSSSVDLRHKKSASEDRDDALMDSGHHESEDFRGFGSSLDSQLGSLVIRQRLRSSRDSGICDIDSASIATLEQAQVAASSRKATLTHSASEAQCSGLSSSSASPPHDAAAISWSLDSGSNVVVRSHPDGGGSSGRSRRQTVDAAETKQWRSSIEASNRQLKAEFLNSGEHYRLSPVESRKKAFLASLQKRTSSDSFDGVSNDCKLDATKLQNNDIINDNTNDNKTLSSLQDNSVLKTSNDKSSVAISLCEVNQLNESIAKNNIENSNLDKYNTESNVTKCVINESVANFNDIDKFSTNVIASFVNQSNTHSVVYAGVANCDTDKSNFFNCDVDKSCKDATVKHHNNDAVVNTTSDVTKTVEGNNSFTTPSQDQIGSLLDSSKNNERMKLLSSVTNNNQKKMVTEPVTQATRRSSLTVLHAKVSANIDSSRSTSLLQGGDNIAQQPPNVSSESIRARPPPSPVVFSSMTKVSPSNPKSKEVTIHVEVNPSISTSSMSQAARRRSVGESLPDLRKQCVDNMNIINESITRNTKAMSFMDIGDVRTAKLLEDVKRTKQRRSELINALDTVVQKAVLRTGMNNRGADVFPSKLIRISNSFDETEADLRVKCGKKERIVPIGSHSLNTSFDTSLASEQDANLMPIKKAISDWQVNLIHNSNNEVTMKTSCQPVADSNLKRYVSIADVTINKDSSTADNIIPEVTNKNQPVKNDASSSLLINSTIVKTTAASTAEIMPSLTNNASSSQLSSQDTVTVSCQLQYTSPKKTMPIASVLISNGAVQQDVSVIVTSNEETPKKHQFIRGRERSKSRDRNNLYSPQVANECKSQILADVDELPRQVTIKTTVQRMSNGVNTKSVNENCNDHSSGCRAIEEQSKTSNKRSSSSVQIKTNAPTVVSIVTSTSPRHNPVIATNVVTPVTSEKGNAHAINVHGINAIIDKTKKRQVVSSELHDIELTALGHHDNKTTAANDSHSKHGNHSTSKRNLTSQSNCDNFSILKHDHISSFKHDKYSTTKHDNCVSSSCKYDMHSLASKHDRSSVSKHDHNTTSKHNKASRKSCHGHNSHLTHQETHLHETEENYTGSLSKALDCQQSLLQPTQTGTEPAQTGTVMQYFEDNKFKDTNSAIAMSVRHRDWHKQLVEEYNSCKTPVTSQTTETKPTGTVRSETKSGITKSQTSKPSSPIVAFNTPQTHHVTKHGSLMASLSTTKKGMNTLDYGRTSLANDNSSFSGSSSSKSLVHSSSNNISTKCKKSLVRQDALAKDNIADAKASRADAMDIIVDASVPNSTVDNDSNDKVLCHSKSSIGKAIKTSTQSDRVKDTNASSSTNIIRLQKSNCGSSSRNAEKQAVPWSVAKLKTVYSQRTEQS